MNTTHWISNLTQIGMRYVTDFINTRKMLDKTMSSPSISPSPSTLTPITASPSLSVGEITPPVSPRLNIVLKKCSSYVGAGIILVRYPGPNTEPEFLLLRGAETGIWSFAKGHPESVDHGYPFYTATREAGEETGFQHGHDYTVMGNALRFGKRFYWFGVLHTQRMDAPVTLVPREHSEYRWFSLAAMQRVATNYDVRSWVKKMLIGSFYTDLQGLYDAVYSWGKPIISPPEDTPSCTTPDTHLTASDHIASLTS